MKDIINFGSINMDYVYKVRSFVEEGETITALERNLFYGGKGLNQSIAAARAGGQVHHAGLIGGGGQGIEEYLAKDGVDTALVGRTAVEQGHAMIQVDQTGKNAIIVYPGSNHQIGREYIDHVLSQFPSGGFLVLQNEISNVGYIIERAHALGFQVVFNASPVDPGLEEIPIGKLAWLMINRTEGQALTGERTPEGMMAFLRDRYPDTGVVLTLGEDGALCRRGDDALSFGVYKTEVVDTTAAGDTFTGYFVASLANGDSLETAVRLATAASALAVSSPGASASIPYMRGVLAMLEAKEVPYVENRLARLLR